ncbi:hypothetical protein [Aquipseudomonas ullengensis]|uniref:Uncharacterized protein n=1 Tax=Aquipseudomonas ullengensis TaxID=2759166 RepID=A0A7W4LIM6_9GAMM|nr:hypothetical protein [Pseudomonas ullengensis]MBB2493865.1 hypothetical protein [Pseudomonas ullengensis]
MNIIYFNGWQRLWVVSILGWAIVVIILCINTWPVVQPATLPMPSYNEKIREFEDEQALRNIMGDKDPAPALNREHYESMRKQNIAQRQQELQAAYESLAGRIIKHVVLGIAFWVLGSVLIYIFGWLVAWVIRGFRYQ